MARYSQTRRMPAEVALSFSRLESEEFESVAQALAIADDGAHFNGIWSKRQRNFQSDNFTGFEAACESGSYAVLSHFRWSVPSRCGILRPETF